MVAKNLSSRRDPHLPVTMCFGDNADRRRGPYRHPLKPLPCFPEALPP